MDPDARFQSRPVLCHEPVGVLPQPLLHPECGMSRTLCMVLLCQRCTKQRENSISSRLRYISPAVAHGLSHDFQRRVDNGAGTLRVEITYQLGGAFEVCKQRR